VSGFDQTDTLAFLQNSVCLSLKPLQISPGEETGARICKNELAKCLRSVSPHGRKPLSGNSENASHLFIRKAIVENSGFLRTGDIALEQDGCGNQFDISLCFVERLNFPESCAALRGVRF